MCIMFVENNIEQKSTKNENALINKKYSSPTIRLTLTLKEPDEESCPVFNYNSLITEEKRKRRREKEENQCNGSVDEPEEGDNEIKRLAQHFEEKYGGVSAKKRKKKRAPKFYNYTDLAAGYDESDSFIDNSEAFDEALPDDMETAFGGYYVNTGQLELKKVEITDETSDLDEIRVGKRKICALKSDDDSSSDGDDNAPSDEENKAKSDEEEIQSVNKKLPEETNHEELEPSESPESGTELKCASLKERVNNTVKFNGGEVIVNKKKKKYKKLRATDENPDELPKPKKKAATVKSMLEEKRIVENGDSTTNEPSKLAENTLSSIYDVIESVVNAARNHSEDSRDSTSSNSDTKSIDSRSSCETEKGSHTDEPGTVESANAVSNNLVKLPDNMEPEVLELIEQIKKCVNDSEGSARSLFKLSVNSKSSVNSKLLKLESLVRYMKSASRHAVYEYLAHFLPCSKDTLMKRTKKLLIEEEERHVTEPLQKLKASINKSMPALLDSYTTAVQRVAEEKCMNDLKNGEVDEKKIIASKMPPKKFIWNEESRRYLRELVLCRLKCFQTLRPRKESSEDYVKKFMETKVKPLWPEGWMETSILMKEAQFSNSTPKVKKTSSACAVNGSASEADRVPTSTTAAKMTPAATTITSAKKPSESPVPNSVNNVHSAAAVGTNAVNYNFLANSLALPSLAMQHPTQTDASYSSAPSTGIPCRSDLNILRSLPTNVPLSMEMIAQFAQMAQMPLSTTSMPSTYSKSVSPPKKSTTPTPPYSTSRSTTPVSSAAPASSSSSYQDKKKSADASSSKSNEMFKIEALINSNNSKSKKEHHMLNHISQYNKHYSHKTEKRKNSAKKEVQVPSDGLVNHKSGGNVSTNGCNVNNKTTSPSVAKGSNVGGHVKAESNRKNRSKDLVLDLSPNNKVKESKCDKSDHPVNSAAETPPVPSSSVTAKDHNYWAGASAREEVKEEPAQDLQSQPRMSFSSPESNSSVNSSKTTHISRKQRILQESAKSMAQTVPDSFSTGLAAASDNALRMSECESHVLNNFFSGKFEEKKKRNQEETTSATDFLHKIINDSLQTPLFEHKKKEAELKSEERVISPADFTLRPSSRDSLSSVGSLNAERRTPNSETADIIQGLVELNQIGNHSIPRRMDYHDSKKHNEFSNGSLMNQSSLHLSDKNKSSSLPRMTISPFQHEFFKHIRKSTNENSSSYNTNSKSQDNCFTSELPSLEVDRSTLNRTSNASKQENLTVFNYQQSVIMPPASARWYLPESKS